jgi:hypothetical protein
MGWGGEERRHSELVMAGQGKTRQGKVFASDDERFFGCVRSDTTPLERS